MTRVFISYRRDDSKHQTGRIYDGLEAVFGDQQVFKDVDSIPLGADFRMVIAEAVASCNVLLAVIGDHWLTVADAQGRRRLDNEGDFVRIEIEAALQGGIPVVPVLVGDRGIPRADDLPASLQELAFRNGLAVRPDPDFRRDMDRLVRGISVALGVAAPASAPRRKRMNPGGRQKKPAAPATAVPVTPKQPASPKVAAASPILLSAARKPGERHDLVLPGDVEMTFAWCPPGTFNMGSEDCNDDEKPVHRVTLTKGFWAGIHPVTQAQWQAVSDNNPSRFQGPDRPVEQVSWDDALAFCQRVRKATGQALRLPTEAEWEYACRAGTKTDYSSGDGVMELHEVGWFDGNSGKETHSVGELTPNAWGLFDCHGNVWEWCADWYASDAYPRGGRTDPPGPTEGANRVYRGGSWHCLPANCRSADRGRGTPGFRVDDLGFRAFLSSE